jgi:hypothetical protein
MSTRQTRAKKGILIIVINPCSSTFIFEKKAVFKRQPFCFYHFYSNNIISTFLLVKTNLIILGEIVLVAIQQKTLTRNAYN